MARAVNISGPRRPLFFPHSEALLLGYDVAQVDLQELDSARANVVGIQNPNVGAVAALTEPPMLKVTRDLPLVEPAGLRSHYARTNILLRNEEMDVAFQPPWAVTRLTITANDRVAPDGALTADKLVEAVSAAQTHYISQAVTVANSTQYCLSGFGQPDERGQILFYVSVPSGAVRCYFDLATGAVVGAPVNVDTTGFEYWGDGYYRVWLTHTTGVADAGPADIRFYTAVGGNNVYVGDGTSGLHLWGVQYEAGHAPSPYIATGAASASSIAPVYYSTDPELNYHAGRNALEFEATISFPYTAPDDVVYPIYELWQDANNQIVLSWNPQSGGPDRWNLSTETATVITAENQNSAFAPVVGTKYLLRLVGAAGGGAWTLTVYSCDVTGMPTALVETITFTNAVTYPALACNRIYLGCVSAGTGQTDLHFWQVGS